MRLFSRLRRSLALTICPELDPRRWFPSDPNPLRLERWMAPVTAVGSAVDDVIKCGGGIGFGAAAGQPAACQRCTSLEFEAVQGVSPDQRMNECGICRHEGNETGVGRVCHLSHSVVVGTAQGRGAPGAALAVSRTRRVLRALRICLIRTEDSWIGDLIGVVSIFGSLWIGLLIGHAMSGGPQ